MSKTTQLSTLEEELRTLNTTLKDIHNIMLRDYVNNITKKKEKEMRGVERRAQTLEERFSACGNVHLMSEELEKVQKELLSELK